MRISTIVLVSIALISPVLLLAQQHQKPRLIVITDIGGDTDDEQSLVRLLYYADHFDIRGIYASSRLGHGQDTKAEIIHRQLEAYRVVFPNLKLHSPGFPDPDRLIKVIRNGLGNSSVLGQGYDTPASDHLIEVVDESEHTVHVSVWGGLRELVQAMWKVKATRSPEELKQFSQKLMVHAIGDQDGHRELLLREFSDLRFIANGFAWVGFTGIRELSAFRGMYMTGDHSMQDGDWVRENIHGNGPLSECYQLHGHGTDGMKEGDSPAFMGLISNGINVPERPDWGGWGGRYRLINRTWYVDAPDFLDGTLNERHGVARWRPAFQRDFAARVKWATKTFAEANHNPIVWINGHSGPEPLTVSAKAGERVILDATSSTDPDLDSLTYHWFVYEELGKPDSELVLTGTETQSRIEINLPPDGLTFPVHLVLEVRDSGIPAMSAYKRIIFEPLSK